MTYKDRVFYNTVFPPLPNFKTIMLFGFLFTHSDSLEEEELRHERIHMKQYVDCFWIGLGLSVVTIVILFSLRVYGWWMLSFISVPILLYYIWYCLDFCYRFLKKWEWKVAYKDIIFERQAYKEDGNKEYEYKFLSFLKY